MSEHDHRSSPDSILSAMSYVAHDDVEVGKVMAMIAIAEELRKMNERNEDRDLERRYQRSLRELDDDA